MLARQHAFNLIDRGAHEQARGLLQDWIRSNPGDIYAHAALVALWQELDDHKQFWRNCNEFYETHFSALNFRDLRHFIKAEQLRNQGKDCEAITAYEHLVTNGFNHAAAWYGLALSLRRCQKDQEALHACSQALTTEASFLPGLVTLADWAFEDGHFAQARSFAKSAASLWEDHRLRFWALGNSLKRMQEYQQAALGLASAMRHLRRGRTTDATRALWTVFLSRPENLPIARAMVYLFWHVGWPEFGRQRMKEALGNSMVFHYVEGLLDSYAAKPKGALKAYAKIADAEPPHPAVQYSRAVVEMDMGHDDRAKNDLRCVIARQPWLLRARRLLAELMLKCGEWGAAKKLCEASEDERDLTLTFEPDGLDIIASLETFALEACLRAGDVEGAVSLARKPRRLPGIPSLLVTQALALAKAGDIVAARRAFDQALQEDESVLGLLQRDEDSQLIGRVIGEPGRSCHWTLAMAAKALNDGDCRGTAALLEGLADTQPRVASRTYGLLGASYEAMGDPQRAKEAYWRGVGVKDDAANVRRLSVLLAQDGNWQELRRLVGKAKNGIEALEVTFELAVRAKDERRILQLGRALLRKGTSSQYVVCQMACRTKCGTMAYANIVSRLVELSPFDFGLREHLIRILLGLRKRDLARTHALALVRDGASELRTLLTCAVALAA